MGVGGKLLLVVCFVAHIHRSTLAAVYFAVAIETAEPQGSRTDLALQRCSLKVCATVAGINKVPALNNRGFFSTRFTFEPDQRPI